MSTCLHSHRIGMRSMRGVPDGWCREPTHSIPLRGVTILSSPHLLHQALQRRQPPVEVSLQACRTWWAKYRLPAGAVRVTSADVLEEEYIAATSVCPAVGCEAPVWQSFGQARAVAMRKTWRFCFCANKVSQRNQCLGLLGEARSDFVLL